MIEAGLIVNCDFVPFCCARALGKLKPGGRGGVRRLWEKVGCFCVFDL